MAQSQKWKKLGDIPERKLTPMLRQYVEAKAEYGDSLLFFRMGDFYEMFFEDAIEASNLLGLTLTSRDNAGQEERIPMAGVPVRTVDSYIAKAIRAGRMVSICDQVEDPKEAKGIVKRAVIRTVTPGTVMEPDLLEETSNNYLAALQVRDGRAGLAFVDVTTGEFLVAQVTEFSERLFVDELTRMAPAEVLLPESVDEAIFARLRARFDAVAFATRPDHEFDLDAAAEALMDHFDLGTLKGVGLEDDKEAAACAGALLSYANQMQRDGVPRLRLPRRYNPSAFVVLDGNTHRDYRLPYHT